MKVEYIITCFAICAIATGAMAIGNNDTEKSDSPGLEITSGSGIKAFHCNASGEVDSLIVRADQPGVYKLTWNNVHVCGEKI